MRVGDPPKSIHVAGAAVELRRHDSSGAWSYGGFDGSGVDQMVWTALDGHGLGAGKVNRDRSSQHCVRTEDDLVAVFDTSGQQRHLQAVSRVADSKSM